jgi:CBS domain-containing protein
MLVSEIMNPGVVSVSPDESVAYTSRLLYRHNIGSVPVCTSDGMLEGIVTDRDIVLRVVAADSDPHSTPVKDIMSHSVITVAPEDDVKRVSMLMSESQVRRLPVVSDGKVVGMVSLGDIARSDAFSTEAAAALSEISENVRKM